MIATIGWDHGGDTRRAIVAGEQALIDDLAAALQAGQITPAVAPGAMPPPIAVAMRHQLRRIPDAALESASLVILLDPTDEDRIHATRLRSGKSDRRLVTVPSLDTIATAEHAMLLILGLARRVLASYAALVAGHRRPGVSSRLTDDEMVAPNWVGLPEHVVLYGKTLGILGLGRVGHALAARAQAFGMRVIYHDIKPRPVAELCGHAIRRRFDQVLREADIVSLHLPLTLDTVRIIDAPELALMQPTTLVINTAHGRLVDEGALIKALRGGDIAGAGLDVFAYEALPTDSPLVHLDNVLLTPHVAGASPETVRQAFVREVLRIMHGNAG